MKMLAIDGNSVINRAFYGIRLLSTKDGRFTNAIFGFTNILLHLIEAEKPDCIVVAWDIKKPTFRHNMFADYKAGRHAMPDELREQIPRMKELVTLLGHTSIECEGYEADDILGTLSRLCEESGNQCVIATGDRDSLQLISDSTNVLLSATKAGHPEIIRYDTAALFEKYGVSPAGMIELKALMGDSSDNIPGVAGIGEKTAGTLIGTYGTIDYIYENLDALEIKEGVREKLRAGKESAYLSHALGTICKTAPISEDIAFYADKPRKTAELIAFLSDLELFKIIDRLDLSAVATESVCEEGECFAAVDFKDFESSKTLDIVSFEDEVFLSSGNCCTKGSLALCRGLLENEKIEKRIFDYKNFYKKCTAEGIALAGVCFDSMLAGYLLSPSASSYDIPRLAQEYSAPYPQLDTSDENMKLAALHSSVCSVLEQKLSENGQDKLLSTIELPLARVLADMEIAGVLVDTDGIRAYGEELAIRTAQIEADIYSLVGYEFNLNSPKQLGVALFEDLGLPAKKKTKSGYSTNAEVLESLRYAHPAVSLLLEYRQLSKLKSTYCDGLLKVVHSDNRIRSTFNQTETRTGRISSLEPNLQNIPVRTEEGKRFRRYFRAAKGYLLCDADYSQIELRVLAHMAGDQNMINAFRSGVDIHTSTAAEVFSMPINMVTPVMRSRAKAVNFGIVYGIGAFSLSKDIGVTRAEADSYIKNYLRTYPQIDEYMKKTIENAKRDGFVVTEFGRRRYIPEIVSSNGMMRAFGERVARNMPIQGTAADIIKIAMIRVSDRLKAENLDARLILQVHDELIVEAREDIADKVCDIIKYEMENSAKMAVALSVDAASGETWFEAKQ